MIAATLLCLLLQDSPMGWRDDWERAMAEAQSRRQLMILDFSASW